MRKFLNRWAYAYAITNILFLLVSFVILRRLNIHTSFLKVSIGSIFISLFIASSITVFKADKLNEFVRVGGGFLCILPIVFIARQVFGVIVFRYSFIVYLFALLCAVIYAVAVIVVSKRYKKEADDLNKLLQLKKHKDEDVEIIE